MEVRRVDIVESPSRPGCVRLQAEVAYDDKRMSPELYWYEFENRPGESIAASGDPWLACLLPLAVTLHEPLRICLPVDSTFYHNAQEIMQVWRNWYPNCQPISIKCELSDSRDITRGTKTAAFFSGGIDSFFTVLRYEDGGAQPGQFAIDDLISVWGFDIPIGDSDAFARLNLRLEKAATTLNKGLVSVATNIRETRFAEAMWGPLSHGCALGSVALAVGARYSNVLIGASSPYRNMHPWGSHPITDPLLSTSYARLVHDGAGYTRLEKTEVVSTSAIASDALHVCWEQSNDANCCSCAKCYRTMVGLELFERLESCSTFPAGLDIVKLRRLFLDSKVDVSHYFPDLLSLALSKRRLDIAKALNRSINRSKVANRVLPFLNHGYRLNRRLPALQKRLLFKCLGLK